MARHHRRSVAPGHVRAPHQAAAAIGPACMGRASGDGVVLVAARADHHPRRCACSRLDHRHVIGGHVMLQPCASTARRRFRCLRCCSRSSGCSTRGEERECGPFKYRSRTCPSNCTASPSCRSATSTSARRSSAHYIERVVDAVNGLGADMIAVTGDLVDGSVRELAQHTSRYRGSRRGTALSSSPAITSTTRAPPRGSRKCAASACGAHERARRARA